MHEVGLVEDAIEAAVTVMNAAGASSIEGLTLAIASGGHVSFEAVEMIFDALRAGTAVEGAKLTLEPLEREFGCWECGHTFSGCEDAGKCPRCGGSAVSPLPMAELRLKYVDLPLEGSPASGV